MKRAILQIFSCTWTGAWVPAVMGGICVLWGLASFRSGREFGAGGSSRD